MLAGAPPHIPWWVVLIVQVILHASAGLLFGRPALRKYGAWVLSGLSPLATLVAQPEPGIFRFVLATNGALAVLHMADLTKDDRDLDAFTRVWFMTTPFDVRLVRRVSPSFPLRDLLLMGVWGALCAASYLSFITYEPTGGAARWVFRWVLGLAGFYAAIETVRALIMAFYLPLGLHPPPLHEAPVLARTVQEFWGERWNLEIHRWLRLHVMKPFVRRRRLKAGVVAVFSASALLHVWIMWACSTWAMTGLWSVFFMIQGVFIIAERKLRVSRWRPALGRVWTVGLLAGASPLFIEPVLRLFDL